MAHRLLPYTSSNRALAQAVQRGCVEDVRAALANGADANTYLTAWHKPLLARVADRLAETAADDANRDSLEAIVQALVEAGVDLAWAPKPQSQSGMGIAQTALHFSSVRTHPLLGQMGVAHLRAALDHGRLSQSRAVDLFRSLTGDTLVDESLRNAVFDAFCTRPYPPDWVDMALSSYSPVPIQHCLRRGLDLALATLSHAIQNGRAQAPALSWWLGQMKPKPRLEVLMGAFGRYGLLALTERNTCARTRDAVWAQALACPGLAKAMAGRGQLPAYLVLAVRQSPGMATALLEQAGAMGVDAGGVRGAAAIYAFSDIFDPKAWRQSDGYPPREGSLVACHLHRHGAKASATVCRKLVRSGVAPQFEDLVALGRAAAPAGMKSSLARLFRDWVVAGLDPEPAGEASVWEQLRSTCVETDIAPFEAWYRSWRLGQRLTGVERVIAGPAKPRL